MIEDHFIRDARAFVEHPSRRTTSIELVTVGANVQYWPYDVKQANINGHLELFLVTSHLSAWIESDPSKDMNFNVLELMEHDLPENDRSLENNRQPVDNANQQYVKRLILII